MENKKPVIVALIVAAGTGERFGGGLPKQYLPLLGRPVLTWSIDIFRQHPDITEVYTVIHPDHHALYLQAVEGRHLPPPVAGGASRQESVLKGLEAIASLKPDYVLIHDAARPGVTTDLISGVCNALKIADAVVPGLAVTDTVKRLTADQVRTESRDGLYAVQTPQGFKYDVILGLHQKVTKTDTPVTDDAGLCENAGQPVKIAPGEKGNFKITHGDDLALMEQNLAGRLSDIRTATGYDVHRLIEAPSRPLKLCGIDVPHTQALEGHSDADVGLHALTDALLGAICEGDIGMHFSPKDARWKNADSAAFLRHAADLIARRDGVITHVDVTIICEAPKVGPHREKMRARIADILALPVQRVSVKATTTEGLGFAGRREGIAAEAIATVRLPFTHIAAAEPAALPPAGTDDVRKWGT